MSNTILAKIPGDDIGQVWDRIAPCLEGACTGGPGAYTMATLREDAELGDIQIWCAFDTHTNLAIGAAGTEIKRTREGDLLVNILFCTGKDFFRWRPFVTDIERWARELGAVRIKGWMRPGWERFLDGYRKTHIMLEKDLT